MTLKKLQELCIAGVFCIVHKRNKHVYIAYSSNILVAISRHLELLSKGNHPNKKLQRQFKSCEWMILETNVKDNEKMLRQQYWMDKYKQDGYNIYNNRNSVIYKVRTNVTGDLNTPYKVSVELVNRRNDKIVVGLFDSLLDANDFIETYYRGPIYSITYAKNFFSDSE